MPGTQSNVAGDTSQQPGSAPERLRQSEVTNYEVSKLVRHTVQPKGTVRRISVAVILDHKTSYTKSADGKVTSTSRARSRNSTPIANWCLQQSASARNEAIWSRWKMLPFFTEIQARRGSAARPVACKVPDVHVPGMKYGSSCFSSFCSISFLFRPIRKRGSCTAFPVTLPGPRLHEPAGAAERRDVTGSICLRLTMLKRRFWPAPEHRGSLPGTPKRANIREEPLPDLEMLDDQIEREFMKEAQHGRSGRPEVRRF